VPAYAHVMVREGTDARGSALVRQKEDELVPSRMTSMWALLAVTTPCPATLLLCYGLVPPAVLAAMTLRIAIREPGFGWIIAGIYVVQLAVVLWLLRWIARRLVSRLSPRALGLTAAGLIVASLAPIYFYDCMDGHSLMRCSMPGLLRAAVTDGNQCGDLGW
jgi:hypothetical protein